MTENPIYHSVDKKNWDVKPEASQVLNWDTEHRRKSIYTVYLRAENHTVKAINWYLISKQAKKLYAQWLRPGTIFLTAMAGFLPITNEISALPTILSSISLGLAGLSLAIDKFFGFSSAWMRFIAAEHQIRQYLHEFQMDYDLEQAGCDNGTNTGNIESLQSVFVSNGWHHSTRNRSMAC